MLEFLHGVYASCFQQFSKLWADSIDAIEVGVVGPAQDELSADASFVFQCLASSRFLALLKQFFSSVNAGSNEFFCIHRANALDVDNLVSHGFFLF